MPLVRLDTTHEPDAPTIVQVAPPGDAVTVCDVAAVPAVAAEIDARTEPSPTTTLGTAGAFGFAIGVTASDAADAADVPPAFVAAAVNVYVVPLVRPDTTHEPEAPTIVHVAPSGDAVTVCDVAVVPAVAAEIETVANASPATTVGAAGTFGFAIGVTEADAADAADVPPSFVAVAVNV